MNLKQTIASLEIALQYIPEDSPAHQVVRTEIRMLQDYEAEYQKLITQPMWIELLFEFTLFLTQGMLYSAFIIRASFSGNATIATAHDSAQLARQRLEDLFLADTQKAGKAGKHHGIRRWIRNRRLERLTKDLNEED